MTDFRAADWRYYLARSTWGSVLIGPGTSTDVAEILQHVSASVERFDPSDPARPSASLALPADLVVTNEITGRHLKRLFQEGYADETTVIVVLGVSWRGLRILRRPEQQANVRDVLALREYRSPSGAGFYYPSANGAARRYAWATIAPATSLKGRLARFPLAPGGLTAMSRIRERAIGISASHGCLVDLARDTVIVSSGGVESKPVIAVEVSKRGRPLPVAHVWKIPRGQRVGMLKREQSKLARVQAILPGAPIRPLSSRAWGDHGDSWGQTAIPGIPLTAQDWPKRMRDTTELAAWLEGFEQATSARVAAGQMKPPELTRWAHSLVRSALVSFSFSPAERDSLERLSDRLGQLGLSLTLAHRDAGPWNILSGKGGPALIDWESAGWGLPGEDLLYLLLYTSAKEAGAADNSSRVSAFRTQFLDASGRPSWLSETLLALQRRLHLDPAGFGALLAATLLSHALRIHHLGMSQRGKQPLDEPFLEMWRELATHDDRPGRGRSVGGPASGGDARPLVSLIMPVWRPNPDWLAEAVRSALSQRGCSIELIVVDDGSPRPVADLLTSVTDDRLRVIRINHGGASRARNAGVAASSGSYLRFIDCDDVLDLDSTAHLLALMENHDDLITYGTTVVCDQRLRPKETRESTIQGPAARECLLGGFGLRHVSMLYPRAIVEAVGEWDTDIPVCQDWDFVLRALEHAEVRGDSTVATYYRTHSGSNLRNKAAGWLCWLGTLKVTGKYLDRHPEARGTPLEAEIDQMLESLAAAAVERRPWESGLFWRGALAHPGAARPLFRQHLIRKMALGLAVRTMQAVLPKRGYARLHGWLRPRS